MWQKIAGEEMAKIFIAKRYVGDVVLPQTKDAKRIVAKVTSIYPSRETLNINVLFGKNRVAKLNRYQKGGAREELENLELYIELGRVLGFTTADAKQLKNSVELVNDTAYTHFNITKRVSLINKKHKSQCEASYLFWDIENFSNISSIFNDLIEPFEIEDEHIYLAANPDSLYLKKREWEANLYDYGKSLNSFNFTKCEHGKNVADDLLLHTFESLGLKNCNVYIMTFDRELKERFQEVCHQSNNLYIMNK